MLPGRPYLGVGSGEALNEVPLGADWPTPGEKVEQMEELIVSSEPEAHVERIREVEAMGATTVALMNNSGADPLGAIGVYGDSVLPRL